MGENILFAINTEDDYERLKSSLRKYTGLKYRKTTFTLSGEYSKYGLKEAIDALNIKNRSKRIEYIYDTACELVDGFNNVNEICCPFTDNRCPDCKHNSHVNGCCYHCSLQSTKGCPTKNLSCKLYFCEYMKEHHHPLTMDDLDILNLLSRSQRAILRENVFVSRKIAISLLKIGSYIVFGLFSVYKLFTLRNIRNKADTE